MLSAKERMRAKMPGWQPDPAGVLAQGAVTHVMRPVLDAPVGADRAPEALGIQPDLADIVGGLAVGTPQAGAGVLAPGKPRDPSGTGDHRLPLGWQPTGDREQLDPTMLLATVTAAVDRRVLITWGLLGAQAHDGIVQARLVGLDPDPSLRSGGNGLRFQHKIRALREAP